MSAYFKKAKKGNKIYGLIFGKGKIVNVFPDSYYSLMVLFDNGYEVPYTDEGIAGWGNFKKQTLFYKKDIDLIDLTNEDFSPLDAPLAPEMIIKLREEAELQVRLPSGIWKSEKKCEPAYTEELLKKCKYHLFRPKKDKNHS